MVKKYKSNDEDIALFLEAMKDTQPLAQEKIRLKGKTPAIKKKQPASLPEEGFSFDETDELSAVRGDEYMVYKHASLSHKLLRKLRKGQYNVDAVIDLHGMSIEEAMLAINECLQQCLHNGSRVVLMIHGKGHHSQMPILKNKLNHWLRHIDVVLAFCSATPAHGGQGAIYVLLKRATEEHESG